MAVFGPIKIATDEDFEAFKRLAASEDEGWAERYNKGNIRIWTRSSDDSPINITRVRNRLEGIEASLVYDVLHDPDYRKHFDEVMIEGYELIELDECNDIGYYAAKLPPGISNRDFLNQRSWREYDNGEFLIINHSVEHEKCPPKKGFVRANSILTGYWMVPEEGGCVLTWVTQTDPRGMLPKAIVNHLTLHVAPKAMMSFRDVCLKYPEWKQNNKPEHKPWRKGAKKAAAHEAP